MAVAVNGHGQLAFFPNLSEEEETEETERQEMPPLCLVATRLGAGFCFDRRSLREATTRNGRTLIRLRPDDEVVTVRPVEGPLLAIATSRRLLLTPINQVNVLAGAGKGIRIINPDPPGVLDFFTVDADDHFLIWDQKDKEKELAVTELPVYNRGAKGAVIRGGIERVQVQARESEVGDEGLDEEH
jgi:DNA gyrase/topoisomerase IV subunit A